MDENKIGKDVSLPVLRDKMNGSVNGTNESA